jgi:PAS domain S-box-containing protein
VPVQTDFRIIHKTGQEVWAEGTVTNLLEEDHVKAYIVNFRDVTARKMAEQLLQKSEANLRTIFDNTEISYVLLDKNFRIVSFNNRAFATYKSNLAKELAEGNLLPDYFEGERKQGLQARATQVLNGEKVSYETSFRQNEGSLIWFNVQMLPVYQNKGDILGLIIALEDITDRKNTELEKEKMTADLIQHVKNLEQFAYIISHNLRSPVANILGLSNMIQSTPDMSKADFERCMNGLALSVKTLDDTIIDLNYILQVRREVSEKKEPVQFSALLKDIKTSIGNLLQKENITIQSDFSEADQILTLKSYLNSIFYNLISNSIKYRHPDKLALLEIFSRRSGNKIFLHFKDNGLGIDLKTNEGKVFGLYKKFHPQIEGKGMGLYMVRTQVEMLGGKIDVKSEVDKGTEFIIELNV